MIGKSTYRINVCGLSLFALWLTSLSAVAQQPVTAKQPKIKLLYIVDAKTEYLIPYIESRIRNLTYPNTNNQIYKVSSFNSIIEKEQLESNFNSKLIELHVENLASTLEGNNKEYKKIADTIQKADLLLKIKINPFNQLIEYQFSLYRVLKLKTGRKFQLNYLNTSVVVINPEKNDYGDNLNLALKKIFSEAHGAPKFGIMANSRLIDSFYYYSNRDTIRLQYKIIKSDSKDEDLTYDWRQIQPPNSQLSLATIEPEQTIQNPPLGSYQVGLTIYDGIKRSDTVKVKLKVINPPKLSFFKNTNSFYNNTIVIQNYIFSSHRSAFVPSIYLAAEGQTAVGDSLKLTTTLINAEQKRIFSESNCIPNGQIKINLVRNIRSSDFSLYNLNDDESAKLKFDTLSLDEKISVLKPGEYQLQFNAQYKGIKSSELSQTLNVLDKSGTGLYLGYLFFPASKIGALGSWLNIEGGWVFNLTPSLAITAAPGISVFNKDDKKFFSDIYLTIKDPGMPLQGSYSWLVYYNPYNLRTESAIGINASYLLQTFVANISIGPTLYYAPNIYTPGGSHFLLALSYSGAFYHAKKK